MLDVAAWRDLRPSLAALLESQQDFVLDLHVPSVVVLPGLEDGTCRRHRVATALHLDRIEEGLVADMIFWIDLTPHHVARLEFDKAVGAGADRLQVGRRLARFRALEVREQVLGDQHAARANKGVGPEGCRLGEADRDREVVDLLDLDVLVAADGHGRQWPDQRRIPN